MFRVLLSSIGKTKRPSLSSFLTTPVDFIMVSIFVNLWVRFHTAVRAGIFPEIRKHIEVSINLIYSVVSGLYISENFRLYFISITCRICFRSDSFISESEVSMTE